MAKQRTLRTGVDARRHLSLPRPLVPMTRAVTRKRVPGETHRVVVIGAGLAGLAAACKLRASGREVIVLEADDSVGGRCRTETLTSAHGDFEADTGATVLTMPSLVESLVGALGQRMPESWQPQRLAPAYHAQFASGRHVDVYADEATMRREIGRFALDKFASEGAETAEATQRARELIAGYEQHRSWSQEMFTAAYENFLAADFDSPLDLIASPASASDLLRLLGLGAFGRLGPATRRQMQDEELERLFTFQALYAGEAPSSALAVYSVISHMDTGMGVYYPQHSIGEAAEVMADALRKAGADIRLGAKVSALRTSGQRVTGVEMDCGELVEADAVVATPDLPLIDKLATGRRRTKRKRLLPLRWSPSAVVIHGTVPTSVAAQWKAQSHHTISFGEAWETTFKEITAPRGKGSLMSDPSLLITRPAVTAHTRRRVSADGTEYEPISILAPAPNLSSAPIDWEHVGPRYVEELLHELEGRGWEGLSPNLAIARVDTPATWQDNYGYGEGTPFALAHSLFQTGPFRPRNAQAFGLDNLVLAGSSTTPGVGVPTVLLSGALAARRITGGGVR